MRPRARLTAALAAAGALACLAAQPFSAAPAANASTKTPATGTPASADSRIGGPLMASQGTVVNYPGKTAPRLPSVPASAYVVANADTGQVLAARDPHGRFGPASTLKVLTAVTLLPLLNPSAMVQASKLATSAEPMSAGLVTGRRYRVSDLFKALLMISANDAAVALTEAVGSFSKGMALINAEAHHLQAYDVAAKLPNGLPAAGQVESAYDEALIARQALASPAFMHYDSTLTARLEVKPKDWETLVNQNWLLTKYPGGIGGKIGWTVSSEATYVGLARRRGVTLIVTILHCTPLQEITSAVKLLNWGFAMNGKVKPVGELVRPLATAAAVKPAHKPSAGQQAARLASGPVSGSGFPAGYAVAAVAGAGGIGIVGLAFRRHRPAANARHRR